MSVSHVLVLQSHMFKCLKVTCSSALKSHVQVPQSHMFKCLEVKPSTLLTRLRITDDIGRP